MKKFFALIIALLMVMVMITGCVATKTERNTPGEKTAPETENATIAEEPKIETEPAVTAATEIKNETLNLNEPLKGTLDEFGSLIQHTDRFAIAGTILDESLFEGQIIVGNAFNIHDNGFISQESNVCFYYLAPANGGRVRMTGFDGQFFVIDKGIMALNQAIAAMRDTLIRAHGATFDEIQFHELVRYGDPVK